MDNYKRPKPKKTRQGSSKNTKWDKIDKKKYRGQGK
jgi:hypothetical protein